MPDCPDTLSKGRFKEVLETQVKRLGHRFSKGLKSTDLDCPRINGVSLRE